MTIDEHTRAFIEKANLNPAPAPGSVPLAAFREATATLKPLGFDREDVAEVRDVSVQVPDAPDVQVRVYRPDADGTLPLVVCAHGGSWVRVTLDDVDEYYRTLANRSGCTLAVVDYRLAPESQFPVAIEETHAAARWAQENAADLGCDAGRLGIFGESSGGNLAAAVALLARDRGEVTFAQQTLVLPVLDCAFDSESWKRLGTDYVLTKEQLEWAVDQYAPGVDRADPLLSPIRADDFSGLPPAVIFTGEFDPLRDDGERYAASLTAAGVRVRHVLVPGLIHHALMVPKAIPLGAEMMDQVATALREALAPAIT